MKGWQHFGDYLLSDACKPISNLPCQLLRYMQRFRGDEWAKEFQPFRVVHVFLLIGSQIACIDGEVNYVREHGDRLAEYLGYVGDLPIQCLAGYLKREVTFKEFIWFAINAHVDAIDTEIYPRVLKATYVVILYVVDKSG